MINVAFAFDKNYYRQAFCAIASLLVCGKNVDYNLYLLIDSDVDNKIQKELTKNLIKISKNIKINFIEMQDNFRESYECRGITKACYYRLMLHRVLPQSIKKIIYSDVDVIFNTDLSEVWNFNMENFFYAANKDIIHNLTKYRQEKENELTYFKSELRELGKNYRNSGFLLLNLQKFRDENLDDKIIQLSKKEYLFQDQDILNIMFTKRQSEVGTLSPKYCVLLHRIKDDSYKQAYNEGIISKSELYDVYNNPAIYHYSGTKPWNIYLNGGEIWWNFVKKHTPYYRYFRKRYKKLNNLPTFWEKIFSVKNEYREDIKRKIVRILGLKFKFKVKIKPIIAKCPKGKANKQLVLNLEKNIRKQSILMVEVNDFHGEIIAGFAKHFFDLGYNVDMLMTEKNYNDNPLCRLNDDRIHIYPMDRCTMKHILQNKKIIDKYNAIFINSYLLFINKLPPVSIYKYFGKILGGKKIINVTHNTWQLIKNKRYVSLAKNSINTPVINPNFFGNVNITPKNDKTIFLISGDGLKEFSSLLKMLEQLINNGISNFKIYITGRKQHSYIDPNLKKYIEYLGFVPFDKLYNLVEQSDFIIPFLDPENPKHDYYITDATSGAFQLCYGFLKPMLIASKFAQKTHLNSDNSIIYQKNSDLFEAMKYAIDLKKDDYNLMQQNLKTTVENINKNSLNTVQTILEEIKNAK